MLMRFLILPVFVAGLFMTHQSRADEYGPDVRVNDCPIILVHGFAGWGPDSFSLYNYWGGFNDIKAILERSGYTVFAASVGAFSSNWDRAIELFYQIKGGQVDYGEEHCRTHGHLRRPPGMFYDAPLYPRWDADHPVHFIGHSMGGQTLRVLSALLADKHEMFRDVLLDQDGAAFTPGEGWIKSITTLSAPHNGVTTFNRLDSPAAMASIVASLAGIELFNVIPDDLNNYDLPQWEMQRRDGETLEEYIERIFDTLGDTEDFSIRELSTRGAERLNALVNFTTVDRTACYFSVANSQTVAVPVIPAYVPSVDMSPALLPNSLDIGVSAEFDPLGIGIRWRENDGIVNTASMIAPLAGCDDGYVLYDGTARRGVWNYMGKLWWDHGDILGHFQDTQR